MIRIGANPIGWSNDDLPELGGETPLETCLAEASSVGFEGMELGNKFPREPAALAAALAPFGLRCVSGWYSGELMTRSVEAEFEAMRPHHDLLKAMGCDVLIFAETSNATHSNRSMPLSKRAVLPRPALEEYARRLTELAERSAEAGLRLAYHHHMGTMVQSRADIDALMEASGPALHLLLDTGHAYWAGIDPATLARDYRSRIAHVHTKDVRPQVIVQAREGDWSFLDAVIAGVYTVPGDGAVDFATVFRELPGYAGWVVIEAEQDPAKAHPLTYARKGYTHVTRVLAETGLRS